MIDYARVSGEIPVSEDEDEEESNSYNNSFIDDRINPTAGCTSAEDSGRDMMAIYRFLIILFLCYNVCAFWLHS